MERDMEEIMEKLARSGREIEESGRELQATVTELQGRKPTCMVEWPEEVAIAALEALRGSDNVNARMAYGSLEKAIAIEKGVGGNFWHGPGAA